MNVFIVSIPNESEKEREIWDVSKWIVRNPLFCCCSKLSLFDKMIS